MRLKIAKQLMLGAFLATTLLVGIGPTVADAQTVVVRQRPVVIYRRPLWRPFWGPRTITVVDPIATQRELGYSEGKDEGKDDAKKGLAANPTGNKHYVKSDSVHFREAFLQGYNEGYREKRNDLLSKNR
jgi:hypothetical protein